MDCTMDYTNNDDKEDLAALSFVEYFSNNFDSSGLLFRICNLQDAVEQALLTSLDSKRILLLYFHNGHDRFSKIFCESLTHKPVQEIIDRRFFLLGWNVEDDQYQDALKKALNNCTELSNLINFIEKKICAALLVVPVKDSITVFSCMRGKISQNDFLSTLTKAEEFLLSETNIERNLAENFEENQNDMGSYSYQQLMLNLLGDRDYDCFEHSEHDLLKDKLGYSLFGPPQVEDGYDKKQKKRIEFLYKTVIAQNNTFSKWHDRIVISFIFNCTEPLPSEKLSRSKKYPDYNPNTDVTPLPIFVLRKCKFADDPCRIFIDDSGRVYTSWLEYVKRNKLHKCSMLLPKNGRYQMDENGNVLVERYLSPACGVDAKILQGADIVNTTAGLVSTGIIITAAIPAVTIAPVALVVAGATGIGVGLYSIGRSAYSLYDRSRHKESLNFANSEARGAYLNIVAGSLGFVGAGANIAVTQLAAQGFNIGRGATAAVNVINIANIGASGISVANSGYDVVDQWLNENHRPSLLTIVQLTSNILFFGHAVYNFKNASVLIEETQANTLRKYQDSLRSNRHRKTFNKLLSETIRRNKGNVQSGQAEVISAIKNIKNRDEVFAVLTRSNKEMNKNGIRFSAENGEILLNGVSIDMGKFSALEKNEMITFLSNLPENARAEPSSVEVSHMRSRLQNAIQGISSTEVMSLTYGVIKIIGNANDDLKDKIINATALIIEKLISSQVNYMAVLDQIFPRHNKYFQIFRMVGGFFQNMVNEVEEVYQKWIRTQDPAYEEPKFATFSRDLSQRLIQIFESVSEVYFIGTNLTSGGLRELLDYFYTWLTKQVVAYEEATERKKRREVHSGRPSSEITCTVCGGITYK